MRININGARYMAHFHHSTPKRPTKAQLKGLRTMRTIDNVHAFQQALYWERSSCIIHAGSCANVTRPCGSPGSVIGVAMCSTKDTFTRATGRKQAFARAVAEFTKDKALRKALHKAYLRVWPPPMKQTRKRGATVKEGGNVGPVSRGPTNEGTPVR